MTCRCRVRRGSILVIIPILVDLSRPLSNAAGPGPVSSIARMDGSAMPSVVVFMDDLMFLSRIRSAAAAQGIPVVSVRKVPDLLEACRQGARPVLGDLDAQLAVPA